MTFHGITFSSSDMYLLGVAGILCMTIIGAIIYRKNSIIVRKREERDKIINEILSPFNDAILNIEHGEHNHISIMNSFFAAQNEAVSRAKAISTKTKKENIEATWNKYKMFYEENAKGLVIFQFMSIPDEIDDHHKEILRSHLKSIIKEIEKI